MAFLYGVYDAGYIRVGRVKTISITIDEHLDDAAKLEAKRRGISKSELSGCHEL